MRRLVAVVVLALLATGTALAAKGDPQKRHTPADTARAKSIVLRTNDLGAGWKGTPSNNSGGADFHCKGFEPDESDLVETGEADSLDFNRGLQYISSSVSLYRTAAQAQASWNRVVKPALLTCLKTLFEQGASSGGTKTTVVRQGTLTVLKLALCAAAFRISFQSKNSALTLNGDVDVVLLGRGRINTVLLFVTLGGSLSAQEHRLAGVVASRMR